MTVTNSGKIEALRQELLARSRASSGSTTGGKPPALTIKVRSAPITSSESAELARQARDRSSLREHYPIIKFS